MSNKPLSLAVVGADHPNKRGPTRWFGIALCKPGDPIELCPEPSNPKDDRAIAVYSSGGIQIGYLTAERAPLIGQRIRAGADVVAVFQKRTDFGAWIRASFDGTTPALPSPAERDDVQRLAEGDDSGMWPDEDWPEK